IGIILSKMQKLIGVFALSACVAAIPTSIISSAFHPRGNASAAYDSLDLCEAARNCETYVNEEGRTMVRFKEGMGPGSDSYETHVRKRDNSNYVTTFKLSDNKFVWGCNADPKATLYNTIIKKCPEDQSACDETNMEFPVQTLNSKQTSNGLESNVLVLKMSGHWPRGQQNLFRDGLSKATLLFQQWERGVNWFKTPAGNTNHGIKPIEHGTCDLATFTNFIDMTVYNGDSLVGYMNMQASLKDVSSGFCHFADVAAAVAGPVPLVGPAIAATFGFVKANCN
ncbi:MAG: hypothetical protein M1814_000585, partial [Vezdaea aestivalis]